MYVMLSNIFPFVFLSVLCDVERLYIINVMDNNEFESKISCIAETTYVGFDAIYVVVHHTVASQSNSM